MSRDTLLIFGDSERDANMLYAVRMFVPDPCIYLRIRGKGHLIVSDLELDRAREGARHCRVLSLSRRLKALQNDGVEQPTCAHVIHSLLKAHRLRHVYVPDNFPLALARELQQLKINLRLRKQAFFPERAIKSPAEVKKISAALMMAEVGLAEGIQAVKNCKIAKNRRLMYHNLPLTSEKLRSIIDTAIIQAGGVAAHTIVAGGGQACDPHEPGHGVLRANEPIVLDVFPRSRTTGYYGDITRTVVKGRASEGLRRMYHTIERAQELAFEHLRHQARGQAVHAHIQEFFKREGYRTSRRNGRGHGFFHGTGHGIGLEIHEAPRVGHHSRDILRAGHVVTVEPGLYYPELGGIRLEDMACITPKGARNLTKFEKTFEV